MNHNNSSEELQIISSNPMAASVRVTIVQILVWFFIFIDIFMLFTFFSQQAFRGNTRYILFAHTLLMDSIYFLLTNLVVLLHFSYVLISVSSCIVLCIVMEIVTICTPLTITAMCIERYVAICMPLRHATISTTGRTLAAIAIISAYSSLSPSVDLFILIFTSPPGYFARLTVCYYDIMILNEWHHVMHVIWGQVDLAVILIIILFCFVKTMLAAQTASGENKQSASKGRRTLLLHALQLFLCLFDMLSPYTEKMALERNLQLYLTIRYFNFVAFGIISRALSSIIYGLRDKKFCLSLIYYILPASSITI